MLNIGTVKRLAELLRSSVSDLHQVAESLADYCHEFTVVDADGRDRLIVEVRNPARKLQTNFLRRLLRPKLRCSPYNHGGVRRRSIKTNANAHKRSKFLLKADIAAFYPSISNRRVYRTFADDLGCAPDVARMATRLTTYKHHLAMGLVTSPILADRVLLPIDQRVAGMCEAAGLVYTRFVDDLTISGPFDLESSGFASSIASILEEHGLKANPDKWVTGPVDGGPTITGVCFRGGSLDVAGDYLAEIESRIGTIESLSRGEIAAGPYSTHSQLAGRIAFAAWINPRSAISLRRRLRSIRWRDAYDQADKLGLVRAKPRRRYGRRSQSR